MASTFVPSRLPPVGKAKHGKKSGSSGASVQAHSVLRRHLAHLRADRDTPTFGQASGVATASFKFLFTAPDNSTRPRRISFALQKEKGEESDTCLTTTGRSRDL
ncbi:hypothetical protein F441_20796 [Phytophthora nicotianae CJ01A1]|uniref:Uncharacterized protein n=3 Tax=Phytophthora nicotianae TaxID=4792 RepID=V9E0W7_PHYNI|nr:hypothetical protein F443_20932 [Phytophthora nicotianae P1569]ETO60914.1 hypothetical protein F444_20946 [Phytophthora nicotianae P1976]ETP02042.1 hypothetical protein F441_20796 [Phytophthora nicotianae CJ01A1]